MTVRIIPKTWTIERAPDGGGDMLVKVDDFVYLTLHYDYRYTCNATQWALAQELVQQLTNPGDTIHIAAITSPKS
jgi:hypothetical protein